MVSSEIKQEVARYLQDDCKFTTQRDLDLAVADMVKRGESRAASGRNQFSLSTMIRGLSAQQGHVLVDSTKEADINYCKALTTGSTPGSYLTPTLQASEVIAMLSNAGVARAAGFRVWPLAGVDSINIPSILAAPTVQYLAQNSAQSYSDPNLGQLSFSMKTARCITAIPNELLTTSSPAIDSILGEIIATAFGESEDVSMFSTSGVSGGPANTLYSASGTTTLNAGNNSANGGNLSYQDLAALLWKSSAAKARGPLVWLMSPRSFWQRCISLIDLQSRPIVQLDVRDAVQPKLFGIPVFVSNAIPENQVVGSGTSQSYIVLLNPKYVHIGDGQELEIQTSTEFLFSANQTAVRGTRRHDFAFGPSAGICLLKGVN